MSDVLTMTPTMLRQFLLCERLAWLESFGDDSLRGSVTPMQAQRLATGVEHEQAVQEAAGGALEQILVESWEDGVRATLDLMREGVEVIAGAFLERRVEVTGLIQPVVLRGRVDRLARRRRSVVGMPFSRSHDSQPSLPHVYEPIEIKHYPTTDLSDRIQLDAYLWMLKAVQTADVCGWFWMGEQTPGIPESKQNHEFDEGRLLPLLERLAWTLDATDAPPVRLEHHCKPCVWYAACRAAVEPQLPISLLSGISRQARDHLSACGITSLVQIAEMKPDDLQRFKGIKTTAHAVHANARAYVEKQPVWFGALPPESAEPGVMFDLETDPFTQRPWSWGWCDVDGNAQQIITAEREETVMLPDGRTVYTVRDTDAAWRLFTAYNPNPEDRIYHWTGFDAGVMRANAPADVRARLGSRMVDLHRSYKTCVRFPVDGASLKVVARYLDFEWAEYDAWDAAYYDYRRWRSSGDLAALSRSCNYQKADVVALAIVWKYLVAQQPGGATAR